MKRPSLVATWPHGWQAVSERVIARVMAGNRHGVWIAPDGRTFIQNMDDRRSAYRPPDSWLVGVFGKATPHEVIEGSVIVRMREIQGMRVAA